MAFQITCIDNFSAPSDGASSAGRTFDCYEDAVAHCKRVIDSFLEDNYKPGMSAEELWHFFAMFGEDASVSTGTGEAFSGWDYANHRCALLCAERSAS